MIAQFAVALVMSWTGWVWLTPVPAAWALTQLPLAVVCVAWLLDGSPAVAQVLRPVAARPARRPPAFVVRPADVATLAAWRARQAPDRWAA